jgi:hypothetical protein
MQTIWHVIVYDDEHPTENYYFNHAMLVHASIAITWSKVRDAIRKEQPNQNEIKVFRVSDEKLLVHARNITGDSRLIRTEADHF